jgi:hypothetical protein
VSIDRPRGRRLFAVAVASIGSLLIATTASAHEVREVGEYTVVVGFIDEPVYVGQKSGLEFFVNKGDAPVEGLEESLTAKVTFQGQSRDLPLSARFGEAGAYESVFFPTAAGPYTFTITGTIEGVAFDESFTAGPDTFGEVDELSGGQFPVQYPAQGDLVADAAAGRTAASQVTIALGLAVAALVVAVVATGLAIAARRRPA